MFLLLQFGNRWWMSPLRCLWWLPVHVVRSSQDGQLHEDMRYLSTLAADRDRFRQGGRLQEAIEACVGRVSNHRSDMLVLLELVELPKIAL